MLPPDDTIASAQGTLCTPSFSNDLEANSMQLAHSYSESFSEDLILIQTQSLDDKALDQLPKSFTPNDIDACAPAGSTYAWVIVACAAFNMMCTFGITNSFGVFSTYYINFIYPDVSTANIAWIGTAMTFFTLSGSVFTGPLTDKFGFRAVPLVGTTICSIALLLTSFTNALWQLVLTQGVMFGIGAALIYAPSVSLTSQWHDKTRPLATGIAVAGSGVGGMLFTGITQTLMESVGYKWTLRILALILLCVSGSAGLFYKRRVSVPRGGVNFMAVAKDVRLIVVGMAGFFINVGLFVIFYYLPTAALMIGESRHASNNLILYINAGSTVGRILMAYATVWTGSINSIFVSYLTCSILILVVMLAVKSMVGYVILSVIFGALSASYISVTPLLLTEFFGTQSVATAIGIMNAWCSIGILVGNPSQGAIYQRFDRPKNSFMAISIWGSLSLFLAAFCYFLLKFVVVRGSTNRIWSIL